MGGLHFRYKLRPVRRHPSNEKCSISLYGNAIFLDDETFIYGHSLSTDWGNIVGVNLKDEANGNMQPPAQKTLFESYFHNPTVRNNFLFFEQYSGLGFKQPPVVCRIPLSALKNPVEEIVPEKFLRGVVHKVFGLPEAHIAIKAKVKLVELKEKRPVYIVSTDNQEIILEVDPRHFFPSASYLSKDMEWIIYFYYGKTDTLCPYLEKKHLQSGEITDSILFKELLVNYDGMIPCCDYSLGFSDLNGRNRFFIMQFDNLAIIDLDDFQKTSLVLPLNIGNKYPQRDRFTLSRRNPIMYIVEDDGQILVFDYENYAIRKIDGIRVDPNCGFLISPNDNWLAYLETNDDFELIGIMQL